jgi:TonB family protein
MVARHLRAPERTSVMREVYRLVSPSGGACAEGRLGNPQVAYPRWERVPQPPGTFSWTYLRGEVGDDGVPRDVGVTGSSGNDDFDRESVGAVERSRFAPVRRHACNFYYVRFPSRALEAPAAPATREFRPRGARCRDPERLWTALPNPAYPLAMQTRRIEGWAILRYDLSPDGRVVAPTILAAEPAAAGGDEALAAATSASAWPSRDGYRGCVVRILFRMAPTN